MSNTSWIRILKPILIAITVIAIVGCEVDERKTVTIDHSSSSSSNEIALDDPSSNDSELADDPLAGEDESVPSGSPAEEYMRKLRAGERVKFGQKFADEELQLVIDEMRSDFPFEAHPSNLEYEKAASDEIELSEESQKRLDQRDEREGIKFGPRGLRVRSLRMLHSSKVADFINQSGFGVTRMIPPSPRALYTQKFGAVKTEFEAVDTNGSLYEAPANAPIKKGTKGVYPLPDEHLIKLHDRSFLRFAGRDSLGEFESRTEPGKVKKVSGFQKHSLTRPHSPFVDKTWQLNRFELVSLLNFDEARVYIAEELKSIDDVADAETRELTEFEKSGLKELEAGEELAHKDFLNRTLVLGAIRASNVCLECHSVKRGQLLGAFSYELIRIKPVTPIEKTD